MSTFLLIAMACQKDLCQCNDCNNNIISMAGWRCDAKVFPLYVTQDVQNDCKNANAKVFPFINYARDPQHNIEYYEVL